MGDYALTLYGTGLGWRNVRVTGAGDMHEAIALAERVTGCRVSHGRGGGEWGMDASLTVDAESGEVTTHHQRAAKPEVALGPPDVVRAIAMAIKSNTRSNNSAR